MKKCVNCGEVCSDNSKFCFNCGTSLAEAVTLTDEFAEQPADVSGTQQDRRIPSLEEEAAITGEEGKPVEEALQETVPAAEVPVRDTAAQENTEPAKQETPAQPEEPPKPADTVKEEIPVQEQRPERNPNAAGNAQQAAGRPSGSNPYAQQRRAGNPQGQPDPRARQRGNGQNPASGQSGQPVGTFVRRTQGMPQGTGRMTMPMRPGPSAQLIRNTARGGIRSALFVLFALVAAASCALGIAVQFLERIDPTDFITIMNNFGVPDEVMNYADQGMDLYNRAGNFSVLPVILSYLPKILIILGALILIATASQKKEDMPTTGFTMVKVGVIIEMVIACIALFAGLVGATALAVSAWISGDRTFLAIAIVVLVIMIVISMMIIMFYFSLLHTRKACMRNAVFGEDFGDVSGYAAVICIIIGVISAISLLYSVVNNKPIGTASAACRVLANILFGIWVFSYRSRMDRVTGE